MTTPDHGHGDELAHEPFLQRAPDLKQDLPRAAAPCRGEEAQHAANIDVGVDGQIEAQHEDDAELGDPRRGRGGEAHHMLHRLAQSRGTLARRLVLELLERLPSEGEVVHAPAELAPGVPYPPEKVRHLRSDLGHGEVGGRDHGREQDKADQGKAPAPADTGEPRQARAGTVQGRGNQDARTEQQQGAPGEPEHEQNNCRDEAGHDEVRPVAPESLAHRRDGNRAGQASGSPRRGQGSGSSTSRAAGEFRPSGCPSRSAGSAPRSSAA